MILPQPGRRLPFSRVLAIVVVVALAAAGTAFGVLRALRREPQLETLVPADTAIFFKIALRPSSHQIRALASILDRLPEAQRDQLVPKIEDFLDESFREQGLDYRTDVKPWLGGQLAVAVPQIAGDEPAVVVLVTVKDEEKARDSLSKVRDNEFVFEVIDGVAYLADKRGHIDALRSESGRAPLSESAPYERAIERVGDDGLIHLWFDASGLAESGLAAIPTLGSPGQGRGAFVVRAEEDGIVLAGHQTLAAESMPKTGRPVLLEATSSGLLGALTFFDLGTIALGALEAFGQIGASARAPGEQVDPVTELERALGIDAEGDLLAWMHGEFSVILGGVSEEGVRIGAVVEVTDEGAADRTIVGLARNLPALVGEDGATVAPHPRGFDVVTADVTVSLRRRPGRVVVGSPPSYAESLLETPADALADDPVYRRVLQGSSEATSFQMFLRIDRLTSAIEGFLPPQERPDYERDVAPYLRIFKALGMRATLSGDSSEFRMFISLE